MEWEHINASASYKRKACLGSHSEVDLLVCFGSLPCCRTQVRFSLRSQTYQSINLEKVIKPFLPRTTVRAVIYKWRKHGTVENLPGSGRPTKITPRLQRQLIQEITKDPTTTSKELQASLASVKDCFPDFVSASPFGFVCILASDFWLRSLCLPDYVSLSLPLPYSSPAHGSGCCRHWRTTVTGYFASYGSSRTTGDYSPARCTEPLFLRSGGSATEPTTNHEHRHTPAPARPASTV
ncbi:hypothetical protein QTP86_007855 [Hemibagrus guttatus]|nr:hypothetical protein QTP86_007855 [Hemibagrus guttatus]